MKKKTNTWSFEGQDGILNSLFRFRKKGFFVDVGCNHPFLNNNTYFFYKKGWRGIGIDGSKKFKKLWSKIRPEDKFINAVVSDKIEMTHFTYFSNHENSTLDKLTIKRFTKRLGPATKKEKVKTTTLQKIFEKEHISKNFELLKIDTEGHDLKVIKSFNFNRYCPRVICVEAKFLNLNKKSKHPIFNFLKSKKYSLIAKTPLDAIFVYKKDKLGWIPKQLI